MKFKRLRIKNYRGVEESVVEFADAGVTLVQGPNEIGKTSLAESVHMLFQYKASSNRQEVRDIKPVHRDVGAEIELEAESGEYHFVYRKQFHKAKSTELEVLSPAPANYTDDEAHEQANRILAETLDKPLWDALIIRQGDMIQQPDLSGQAALMQALDGAAGGEGRDRRAESLFERVEAEYGRYYQRNGREGADLTKAADSLEQAREREAETAALLSELEKKSERSASLKRRQADLRAQGSVKKADLDRQRELVREVEALERELAAARLEMKTAESAVLAQQRETKERERLLAAVKGAAEEAERLAKDIAGLEPRVREATERFEQAKSALARTVERKRLAEAAVGLARSDCDHMNNMLHLDMMRERRTRLLAARERKSAAERELAGAVVDEAAVKRIRESELSLTRLRAQLDADAPKVVVRGLGEGEIAIAGEHRTLKPGETIAESVADVFLMTVPGRLEVEVSAGGGLGELSSRFEGEQRRLEAFCRELGVDGSSGAVAALERRRRAEAELRDIAVLERDNLRDLTFDDFMRRLAGLEADVSAYASERNAPGGKEMPESLDAARQALADGESALAEASSGLNREEEAHAVHRNEWEQAVSRRKEIQIAASLAAKSREQAESELSLARASVADVALSEKQDALEKHFAAASRQAEDLERRLKDKNPDKVRALAEALTGSLTSIGNQLHEVERELAGLTVELSIRGEEGLFEIWQAAVIDAEEKGGRLAALRSRAEAAKLLYETMRQERERARRAYIAPLKGKIEELGRVVWDASFQVHMNEEDLSIASRTLAGVTVPFASLSGGAREQLSLIFRAACAIIVSNHAGMPLILDDALGYTDNDRLRLMGAVLAKAAEQCQVVIFTCVPERYDSVGDAKVIQL